MKLHNITTVCANTNESENINEPYGKIHAMEITKFLTHAEERNLKIIDINTISIQDGEYINPEIITNIYYDNNEK